MNKNEKKIGQSVGFLAKANPVGLQKLLAKHGVKSSVQTKDLISKTVEKLSDDKFFQEFKKLIKDSLKASKNMKGGFANMDGYYSNQDGASGSSTDWGSVIGGVLNLGGSIWGTSQANKLTEAQIKAQAQASANELEKAKIEGATALQLAQLQLAQMQNQKPTTNATMMYVGIGLAVVLVGTLLFVVLKKK